jgi:hypothetical protein
MSDGRHGHEILGQNPAILERFDSRRVRFGAIARRFAAEAELRHIPTKSRQGFCPKSRFIAKIMAQRHGRGLA